MPEKKDNSNDFFERMKGEIKNGVKGKDKNKIYEILADVNNLLVDYEWSDIGRDKRFNRYLSKINKAMNEIEGDDNNAND